MRNLNYVAIEGAIGVGKTSLAKLLSDRLGAKLVLEKFEDNPFLSEFYEDPGRFAFQTQLFFLLQRYQQQQELRQVDMFHNHIDFVNNSSDLDQVIDYIRQPVVGTKFFNPTAST